MVESEAFLEGQDYLCNFYRYKLYDKETKHYLLTTDDGAFSFLSSSAFRQLRRGKIQDKEIFEQLVSRGLILTSDNISHVVAKTAQRYAFLSNGTSLHIVIPTSRCNLGCSYCFASPDRIDADREKTDLTPETALKIIDFIMSSPAKAATIEFQGGEALARFDLLQLMTKRARELNLVAKKVLRITLVTNLVLMTESMAAWLIDNDVSICTSFDGPKQVHDKNRVVRLKERDDIGTYDTVSRWIFKLQNMYKERGLSGEVGAIMTTSRYSLPYYKEIIDEYIAHHLSVIDLRSLTYVGEATKKEHADLLYEQGEFIEFYKKALAYLRELNERGNPIFDRLERMFETKVLENKPTYHADYESPCGAATGQITYHSNGDIYTCHEALGRDEFKIGNVYGDSWRDIFGKPQTAKAILNSMLEQNVLCDRCVYKPYCGTCMVENFYHFKKFHYYPTKTFKHHETQFHANRLFDSVFEDVKRAL